MWKCFLNQKHYMYLFNSNSFVVLASDEKFWEMYRSFILDLSGGEGEVGFTKEVSVFMRHLFSWRTWFRNLSHSEVCLANWFFFTINKYSSRTCLKIPPAGFLNALVIINIGFYGGNSWTSYTKPRSHVTWPRRAKSPKMKVNLSF